MLKKVMTELDEVWARKLGEAQAKAQAQGRDDVADYLALRTSNDRLRQASVEWLLESLTEIAAFENRNAGARITIETETPHRFAHGGATLTGALVKLRQGVRCLSVEAGWTRAPADGFMRGGALAVARVAHFGIAKRNAELVLILENNAPHWFSVDKKEGKREPFDAKNLQEHFRIFLG